MTPAESGAQYKTQSPTNVPVKVGYVNARAILQGMPDYKKAESTYVKEMEGFQGEVKRLQTSFDSSAAEFEQSSAMMTPTNRATKRKTLDALQEKLQQRVQELQEKARTREAELLAPMRDRLASIIDGIRAEDHFAYILDMGSQFAGLIVSYDKSLDVTQKVVQRLLQAN